MRYKPTPTNPTPTWQTEFKQDDAPWDRTCVQSLQRGAEASDAHANPHTNVFLRLNIFQIGDVDTVACTFTATFFITATWLDRSLEFAKLEAIDDAAERAAFISQSFDPDLEFMNAVGQPVYEGGPTFELVEWRRDPKDLSRPAICVRMRVTGTFREKFELGWFPFDVQPLNIIVTSKHRSDRMTLHGETENSRVRTEFMVTPEFTISPVAFASCTQRPLRAAHKGYPFLYGGVVAWRKHGYYSWNVFLPTFMLTLMSVATFAVPAGDVADRLGVILTLVLTSVAFKFIVAQSLPKIPYNTCLDWYVLISFVILSAIVTNCAAVGLLVASDEKAALAVDRAAVWAFLVVFSVWQLGTLGAILLARRKMNGLAPFTAMNARRIGPSDCSTSLTPS